RDPLCWTALESGGSLIESPVAARSAPAADRAILGERAHARAADADEVHESRRIFHHPIEMIGCHAASSLHAGIVARGPKRINRRASQDARHAPFSRSSFST